MEPQTTYAHQDALGALESPQAKQPSPAFALLTMLRDKYPVIGASKPLAIGAFEEIQTAHPDIDEILIRRALAIHTKGRRYQADLAKGKWRWHIDGSKAGPIDPKHAKVAQAKLEALAKKHNPPAKPKPVDPPVEHRSTKPEAITLKGTRKTLVLVKKRRVVSCEQPSAGGQ